MSKTKKLFSRLLIDLPVDVHKTLKVEATGIDSTVKQLIEDLAISRARRIEGKQIELFNKTKK